MAKTIPLGRFFDSTMFSDLTIQFGSRSKHVHKVVLCSQSRWFKNALEGNFKEASQSTLELHDDSPRAVDGMLSHFYTLEPQLSSDFPTKDVDIEYIVELYAVSNKYDAPELREQTLSCFDRVMTEEKCMALWSSGELSAVVAAIYKCAPLGSSMRGRMVKSSIDNATAFKEDNEELFRNILEDIPEYAADIAMAILEERRATEAAQTTEPRYNPDNFLTTRESVDTWAGVKALHSAAGQGDVDTCTQLLDGGEDIEAVDDHGETPLSYAAWYGHIDTARILVERGANVNASGRRRGGATPLTYARSLGHQEVVNLLVERGARG